jgi:hypothetical protein
LRLWRAQPRHRFSSARVTCQRLGGPAHRPTARPTRGHGSGLAARSSSEALPSYRFGGWLEPLRSECGHPPHRFDDLPKAYVYLLGLYLGMAVSRLFTATCIGCASPFDAIPADHPVRVGRARRGSRPRRAHSASNRQFGTGFGLLEVLAVSVSSALAGQAT